MKIQTQTLFVTAIFVLLLASCNQKKAKEHKETSIENPEKATQKTKDYLVYENLFLGKKTDNLDYNNTIIGDEGVSFSGTENAPSYVRMSFSDLDFEKPFNISFSYKTTSDIGSTPQALIAFTDDYSSPVKVPFYVYLAAKRITGVYGTQVLWAEDYNRTKGDSKAFYDSYPLESNTFYFVSVNFTGNSIEIYVNSELYALFPNLKPHELTSKYMLIGACAEGNTRFVHQFQGVIHGVKIFKTKLNESQIIELYNKQPYL